MSSLCGAPTPMRRARPSPSSCRQTRSAKDARERDSSRKHIVYEPNQRGDVSVIRDVCCDVHKLRQSRSSFGTGMDAIFINFSPLYFLNTAVSDAVGALRMSSAMSHAHGYTCASETLVCASMT